MSTLHFHVSQPHQKWTDLSDEAGSRLQNHPASKYIPFPPSSSAGYIHIQTPYLSYPISLQMDITALINLYTTHLSPRVNLPARSHVFATYLHSLFPSSLNLSLAPLLALADFTLVSLRTIQTGTSSLLDILVICPGLHKQSTAGSLNAGEYPATAAMTSGYVFRTENQAMVYFLQQVGVTGSLVTLSVNESPKSKFAGLGELVFGPGGD